MIPLSSLHVTLNKITYISFFYFRTSNQDYLISFHLFPYSNTFYSFPFSYDYSIQLSYKHQTKSKEEKESIIWPVLTS